MDRTIGTTLGPLHVEITGSGPVALLWHSLFLDNRQWDRITHDLAQSHQVVAIEGPGHGQSKLDTSRFSLEDCASAALQVMDALDIEHADWIGNAWGGHVGVVFAAHYPDRLTSLIAIGTPLTPLVGNQRRHIQTAVWMYRALGSRNFLANAVLKTLLTPAVRERDREAVETVRGSFTQADRRAMGVAMQAAMLGRPDLTRTYNALTVPRLLVAGTDDELWTPQVARALVDESSNSHIVGIVASSHVPPLEQPAATVTVIREFWHVVSPSQQKLQPNLVA